METCYGKLGSLFRSGKITFIYNDKSSFVIIRYVFLSSNQ